MSAQDSQSPMTSMDGRMGRELTLRTQLLVMFILVALLPGLLISGVLLILRLSSGTGSLADISGVGLSVIIVVISIVVASGAAFAMAHEISRRIGRVTRAANAIAVGHWDRRLPVDRSDEIGQMAAALNQAIERLQARGSRPGYESAANAGLVRRLTQLATAIRAVHESASDREDAQLLSMVADQIVAQFDVDHVGIYLLDDARRFLVLQAASASNGTRPLTRGFRLALDDDSNAAAVAGTGVWRLAKYDVRRGPDPASGPPYSEAAMPDQPQQASRPRAGILPETRSELNLPVRIRGRLVGVLNVQARAIAFGAAEMSEVEAGFLDAGDMPPLGVGGASSIDALALQIVADQVGMALANAQLLAEAEERVREIARLVQAERDEGWRTLLSGRHNWRYVYDGVEVGRADADRPALVAPDMVIPLGPTDRELGTVAVQLHDGDVLAPEDVDLARAIAGEASQALERARLFQGMQTALEEVAVLYRCSRAIVAARSPEQVLRAIAAEVGAFDGVSGGGIDCGILLLQGGVESARGIRFASVWAKEARLGELEGAFWSRDRLPILDLLASDAILGDVICLESITESALLDPISHDTLAVDLGLRSALIVRLGARLASSPLEGDGGDGRARRGDDAVLPGPVTIPVGWLLMGSSTGPYVFSEAETRIYLGIADLAGTAIRNFQLLDLASERARRAQLVGSISTRVRETLDMDLVLQTALREIGENLGISSIEVQMQPLGLEEAVDRSPIGSNGAGEACNAGGVEMERDT